MSLFGRSSLRPADPVKPEDAMMIDIQLFDNAGHWSPRKVIFSASVDEERAKSLKVTLFGAIMRLHARLWVESYVKTHLSEAASASSFLANVRSCGVVSRQAFFGLVADDMLGRSPALRTEGSGSAEGHTIVPAPHFDNPIELIHDHVKNIDWENLDEKDFPKFTQSHTFNLTALIDKLAPHRENDQLIARINNFSSKFQDWARKISDKEAGKTILKEIAMPLQKAIDSYRESCDPLSDSSSGDACEELEAHDFIEQEYLSYSKKHPGYPCLQYQSIVDSCFLEYCKDGDVFFERASVSVLEDMDRKILQIDPRRWANTLASMSEKQKAEINLKREQLRRVLPDQINVLKAKELQRDPASHPIPSNFNGWDMRAAEFFVKLDWKSFDNDKHFSRSDIEKIALMLDDIEIEVADNHLVDALAELLALSHREIEWAKSFFTNESEFSNFRKDINENIILPAMDVLKKIALSGAKYPSVPKVAQSWLSQSSHESDSEDEDKDKDDE